MSAERHRGLRCLIPMPAKRIALMLCVMFAVEIRPVMAYEPVEQPPKVLVVVQEQVEVHKRLAPARSSPTRRKQLVRDDYAFEERQMNAISGPDRVWRLFAFDSFAHFGQAHENGKLLRYLSKDRVDSERIVKNRETMVLQYRPDLSYRPQLMAKSIRYMSVRFLQIKTGGNASFDEGFKLYNKARERQATDDSFVVYQVTAGAKPNILVQFRPAKSASLWDEKLPKAKAILGEDYERFVATVPPVVEGFEDHLFMVNDEQTSQRESLRPISKPR